MINSPKIKGLGYAFGFFVLYYVISVAVSFVAELAVILRYFPAYVTGSGSLTEEQYNLLINKLYSLDGVLRIITTALMIGAVALIFKLKKLNQKEIIGIQKTHIAFGGLSYFGGVFAGVSLSCLLTIIPLPESWTEANAESVQSVVIGNPVLVMISIFIAAPLLEELVFRGLMMGFIKKYWNTTAAVIITAVLFGVIHGNILQGLYTFIAALVFTYFRFKGNSFWCAFLAHCGFNMSNILTVLMGDISDGLKLGIGLAAFAVIIYGAEAVFSDKTQKIEEDKDAEQ